MNRPLARLLRNNCFARSERILLELPVVGGIYAVAAGAVSRFFRVKLATYLSAYELMKGLAINSTHEQYSAWTNVQEQSIRAAAGWLRVNRTIGPEQLLWLEWRRPSNGEKRLDADLNRIVCFDIMVCSEPLLIRFFRRVRCYRLPLALFARISDTILPPPPQTKPLGIRFRNTYANRRAFLYGINFLSYAYDVYRSLRDVSQSYFLLRLYHVLGYAGADIDALVREFSTYKDIERSLTDLPVDKVLRTELFKSAQMLEVLQDFERLTLDPRPAPAPSAS